jgi:bifunctional enzyme CysN/CysC
VAHIVNLSKNALAPNARLQMILATRIEEVVIDCVHSVRETGSLALDGPGPVPPGSWAEVSLRSDRALALDEDGGSTAASRFVLIEGGMVAAIGIVAKASETDLVAQPKSKNIASVAHGVRRTERERNNGHRGGVLWFTGLPASGKSTLALLLEQRLYREGIAAYVLDGDNIRRGLSADLGFSAADRSENLRRVAEVAKLLADAGFVCIAAFISPLRRDRDQARAINGADFHEIYIKASLPACEARDPKGLYRQARAGLLADFSGVGAPYEPPSSPDLIVDTEHWEIDACVERIFNHAVRRLVQMDTRESPLGRGVA